MLDYFLGITINALEISLNFLGQYLNIPRFLEPIQIFRDRVKWIIFRWVALLFIHYDIILNKQIVLVPTIIIRYFIDFLGFIGQIEEMFIR